MNILVFGAQGSGKSTHAKYIAEKLKVPYIYTGDLFRELENENSERGKRIRELMHEGRLIPDEISIPAFEEYLNKFDISAGIVLDGFPRNLHQAQYLPIKLDLIIYITLTESVAIERLKLRGRYDDTSEGIKNRLALYKTQTEPIIKYFEGVGVPVKYVDNSPSIEEVRKTIDDQIKE